MRILDRFRLWIDSRLGNKYQVIQQELEIRRLKEENELLKAWNLMLKPNDLASNFEEWAISYVAETRINAASWHLYGVPLYKLHPTVLSAILLNELQIQAGGMHALALNKYQAVTGDTLSMASGLQLTYDRAQNI